MNDEEGYCWTCGNSGEIREHPVDDLSGYVSCPCEYGVCDCGCCDDYCDEVDA